MNKLTVVKI